MGDHSSRAAVTGALQATNPGGRAETSPAADAACRPYSVLLPVGFTVPSTVTGDAVRSYRTLSISRGRGLRDLLSVALSLGSPPPDVIRHRRFVEPGLSSPGSHPPRSPDPLASGPLTAIFLSVIPARLGQQQRQQQRAALAVDDAVDQLGPEAPLKCPHCRFGVRDVIAEPLQRQHEPPV